VKNFLLNLSSLFRHELEEFEEFYSAERYYIDQLKLSKNLLQKLFSYLKLNKPNFNVDEAKSSSEKVIHSFVNNLDRFSFEIFKKICINNFNIQPEKLHDLSIFFQCDLIIYYFEDLNGAYFKKQQELMNYLIGRSQYPIEHICLNLGASICSLFHINQFIEDELEDEPQITDFKIGCLRFFYLARVDDLFSLIRNKYALRNFEDLQISQRCILNRKPFLIELFETSSKSKFIKEIILGGLKEVNLLKQMEKIFTNEALKKRLVEVLSADFDMILFIHNGNCYEEIKNIYLIRRALQSNVLNNYVYFEENLVPVFDFLASNFSKESELSKQYYSDHRIKLYTSCLKSCRIKYTAFDCVNDSNKSLSIRELSFILHKLIRDYYLMGFLGKKFAIVQKKLVDYHSFVGSIAAPDFQPETEKKEMNKSKRENEDEEIGQNKKFKSEQN
jgi:hypothetical protein